MEPDYFSQQHELDLDRGIGSGGLLLDKRLSESAVLTTSTKTIFRLYKIK